MAGIRVELELADGTFVTRMLHAGETVQRFNQNVAQSVPRLRNLAQSGNLVFRSISRLDDRSRSLLGTFRDLTVVIGGVSLALNAVRGLTTGWIGAIVRTNAEIERMTVLMRSMAGSTEALDEAGKSVEFVRRMALNAPFALRSLQDAFVKLRSTGTDPMAGSMQSLVDGVAAFGGTEEVMKRATIAIQQMMGKGVIQMEELRQQLGEAIPRATELMARSMGISFGELVQAISTGTVKAKPALDSLFRELDRVYGGAARRQMETFNGQLAKLQTQLQTFALNVGKTGFFAGIKDQMKDLNAFLGSDVANALAKDLGLALNAAVRFVRDTIDAMIEFRRVIVNVGETLLWVFGARVAIGAIASVSAAFTKLSETIALVRTQIAVMSASFASVAGGASRLGLVSAGVAGIGAAVSGLLPLLPLLGLGLYEAARYFGIFGDRAGEATEQLRKFGAQTRAQIQPIIDEIQRLEAEITRLENVRNTPGFQGDEFAQDRQIYDDQIAESRKRIAELQKDLPRFLEQIEKATLDKARETALGSLEYFMERVRATYDLQANAEVKRYAEEAERLNAANKSTEAAQEEHQDRMLKLQVGVYSKEIALIESLIASRRRMIDAANEQDAQAIEAQIGALTARMTEVLQQRLAANRELGIDQVTKGVDTAGLLKKATEHLERLKADAANYRAEIAGANGETAKLVYQLFEAQRYGDPMGGSIKETIEQLIEAQDEAERLQEIMNGRAKLEERIASATLRIQEKLLDLQMKGQSSEIDRIQAEIDAGRYPGFGPGQQEAVQLVESFKKKVAETARAAEVTGDKIQDEAFGQQSVNSILETARNIRTLTENWMQLNRTITSTPSLQGAFTLPGNNTAVTSLSGSFFEKLIGVESGGNPNAKNGLSSATGIGQFIKGTWLEFLKDMHPEFTSMSVQEQLGLRNDPNLSREAILWYTQRNARSLVRNGFQANDANLYLSHLFGPGGALKALNANPNASTADVFGRDVLAANPKLIGMTVGEVIKQIQTKFGTGFTAQIGAARATNPARRSPGQDSLAVAMEEARQAELAFRKIVNDDALVDKIQETRRRVTEAGEVIEDFGSKFAETRRLIRAGEFGPDTNPDSERYTELLKSVRELDAAERARDERRKDVRAFEASSDRFTSEAEELRRRAEDARRLIQNPAGVDFSSTYQNQVTQLERMVQQAAKAYGKDSEEYRRALAQKQQYSNEFRNVEVLEYFAQLAERNQAVRNSFMTERQERQANLQHEIQTIRERLAAFRGSAEERVLIEKQAQEAIANLQRQANQNGPWAKQLREWGDFAAQFEQTATGWLNSTADALTDLITTGKADFKSLIDSMIRDFARMAINSAFSGLFGGKTSGVGVKGLSQIFRAAHFGGEIGKTSMTRRVDPMVFANAPRFHNGGLLPNEMPLIAEKGEYMLSKEDTRRMMKGGGSAGNVYAPTINVNANGGTPEQNRDLAEQIAREVKVAMQQNTAAELRRQQRPGGMLDR